MSSHKHISYTARLLAICLMLLTSGCRHRQLSADDGCEEIACVHVTILWEDDEQPTKPSNGMMTHLFPVAQQAVTQAIRYPVGVDGGYIYPVNKTVYHPVCYDYEGNRTVYFRNEQSREQFEAYCQAATGTYNIYADMQPGEVTVAEPDPHTLYMARNEETFAVDVLPGDTLELLFEPDNVLHEYTFLIHGVKGLKNVSDIKGAISGMAGSYFPGLGKQTASASTILFTGVETYIDGQQHTWDADLQALFPAGWDDPVSGWTDDWIVGRFCAFGVVSLTDIRNRLTIECLTPAYRYYYASWGYWLGQWEETVSEQLWASMGVDGTPEEQQAWRARNGGFDIVLDNDERLVIPDEEGGGDGGGFDIGVGEWDDVIVPLG
ncbi:MAG: DUF5119 domain-containing protein [Prevotellaceae bacterium]|jgi:hypothetical protein|nr:DUF5119 domain-containing protein [Prevotellaceae bacterium]